MRRKKVSERLVNGRPGVFVALALLAVGVSCRPRDGIQEADPGSAERPLPAMTALVADRPVERRISAGEVHRYALDLEEGDFVRIDVDQRGADVVTTLLDPAGRTTGKIDRRTGSHGLEPLLASARYRGRHRLEVQAFGSEPLEGGYEVRLVDRRPASDQDRLRVRAASVFARGEDERRRGDYESAERSYREALETWRAVADRFWEAETLDRLGVASAGQRRWQAALESHLESARLFEALEDPRSQALALNWAAKARFSLGQIREALADFERALELRPLEDRSDRAVLLVNLAQTHQTLGRNAEAFDHYDEALRLLDESGDSNAKAQVLHQMGLVYRTLGESERSLDYLDAAAEMRARLNDPNGRAASIHQRGRLWLQLGKLEQAFEDHQTALDLRRSTSHARGQVAALTSLGEVARRRGDRSEALAKFRDALKIARAQRPRSPQAEARILWNLGVSSEPAAAIAYFEGARDLYRAVEDAAGEAQALLGIARAKRREGNLEAATESVEAALELVESLRPSVLSDDLNQSYSATMQGYFEVYIELLMDLEERVPGVGYAARALAAAERARARALLDRLNASGAEFRSSASASLIGRERELQRQVNAAERWRLGLLEDRNSTEEERQAAARTVRGYLDELGRLRAEIRRESPHYAALTQPETLTLHQIQRLVLDERSLLLEYWLGEERSFLFLVSREGLSSFELPGRERVEASARRVHRLLERSHRPEARRAVADALCDASRTLLAPIAGRLEGRRLLIVADGALQYLPFSALADPRRLDACPSAPPLLLANETAYLPSASVLATLRLEAAERARPRAAVAVVADPVFSSRDPRLGPVPAALEGRGAGTRTGQSPGALGRLARLPHSRTEAEAIVKLAGANATFRAVGFEARKELLLEGALSGFRVVHLATHAVLDSSRPGLSGIVFSLVDEKGDPQDGLLRMHELYGLRLPAELVVLSACRTALGKEVRGEGLIGWTRAFAYAGAERLIVGLWDVDDRSTATLMERLYRNLLVQGLSPSAALRQAQLSSRSENPAPYYWAAFVHQGEYRDFCCNRR